MTRLRAMCLATAAGLMLAAAGTARAADPFAGLPDPTRPAPRAAPVAAVAPGELVLQATLVSPRQRHAIINGRRLAAGERIEGATIMEINPYEVTVKRPGGTSVLRLLPRVARTRSVEGG